MKELTDEQYAEVLLVLQENKQLREKIIEYEADLFDLKDLILKFLAVIGFGDGTRVYPELLLPEDHPQHKSPMTTMIRAMGDFGQLALASKFSKAAEGKLRLRFAFIEKYTPLILKYGAEENVDTEKFKALEPGKPTMKILR